MINNEKECKKDCIIHSLYTHNTCLACEAFYNSPYFQDDFKNKSKKQIEKERKEALKETSNA